MFFELALLGCVLQIVQAACVIDIETGTQETTKCKKTKCDVTIGTDSYCSQCSKNDDHLIDGKCVTTGTSGAADKCTANNAGACTSCGAGYFLHKGGCYKKGQQPGQAICKDTADTTAGVCDECQAGFFKSPSAANNKQSCIACNETVVVDNAKGTPNCIACTPPAAVSSPTAATCTKCDQTKYLKDGTCVDKTGCTPNTEFAKQDSVNGNRCVSCGNTESGVDGCAKCTAPSGESTKPTCTECNNNKIVKTEPSGTSCVEEAACVDGFFVETVSGTPSKKCTACADSNCAVCTAAGTGKCSKCKDGYTLDSQANTCTSSSANRSGLSSGAIAGISVAVIAVVGGLVGFLCWWFVCRGKA
ncbi:Variant-specific surface protein [Giardia duodenalis]|uniref:Variant-specific surface protein n=1 Tax=Giardia intestinalis TaxID=5741 RepID=V6TYT0_GIAIN|nr:Variant-specific surface protein [Giardia intestinalis]